MPTSAEILFENMEFLYENIYNLLLAFQQASTTNNQNIEVPIKDKDGNIQMLTINSNLKLLNELQRIDNNFISLLNEENISYIVNADGSIGQVTKTSFGNAEYLTQFGFGLNNATVDTDTECIIDRTSIIRNMVFPNVKIPIVINSEIRSKVNCLIYDVTEGYDLIPSEPKLLDIKYLISNGSIIATEEEMSLDIEKQKVRYFGKFTTTEVNVGTETTTVRLADIKYSGINTLNSAIDLAVNDILVTKDGMVKYRIDSINVVTKLLVLTKIAGSGNVTVGIDNLMYNEILPTDSNIVGIPVQPNKKMVVFLATENLKFVGYPSVGIKLNTETYRVVYENQTYTLNEYFGRFVTNFSDYLFSLINETNIPFSLGVIPTVPTIEDANFTVVQINRHLTNAKSKQEIEALNIEKQKVKNKIEAVETNINQIQNEVDTLKFKSLAEKTYRIEKIVTLRNEKNVLEQNLLTVTRKLDNNATETGLKNIKPKYRVLGSWAIQAPIYSPKTKPQHIIRYDVQYRYLSKNLDVVETTNMKMINNGQEITISYSPWINLETKTLRRVQNTDGTLTWETPKLDSVDDININQLSIPIQEGESVEFRVRAVTEAGYPISPLTSEWTEIKRINFPDSLVENNINTIVTKNELDLRTSEFNNILKTSGILSHISGEIQEAEKRFFHKAEDIASGFYTPEQKIIALHTFLREIRSDIDLLKSSEITNTFSVEVTDFKGEKYPISNNTTIEIDAGNYSDAVNLLDSATYGSIIRKQGFIKLRNQNTTPIEIKTLVPGEVFNSSTALNYFEVGVRKNDRFTQNSRQILYFRNLDITGQQGDAFKLVTDRLTETTNFIDGAFRDFSAAPEEKNIAFVNGSGNVELCKLVANIPVNFNVLTKEHPAFDIDNMNNMLPYFEKLKQYTDNLKAEQYQDKYFYNSELDNSITANHRIGFDDTDLFAVGLNTCGAFLYPMFPNDNLISVVGNSTTSTLILPKESEIIIPFIYEYRMMDRLGNINGVVGTSVTDNLKYSKKIGIDLLINNQLFKFDINVVSKLRSNVTPIENLNVSTVTSLFNNEDTNPLN